ncbi:hypothetical protein I7331_21800, partial [Frankia sp. AgB1.8]|nr:hypothetical protein [Frankia sp. AgB1.8]
MIRSGPVLAGPRTIEHIRSLLALIDLHQPNEFDVCLGCDRLWPCASVVAVTGLPPELPGIDDEVAPPRPLPGATRRAITNAMSGAHAIPGASPHPRTGAQPIPAAQPPRGQQPIMNSGRPGGPATGAHPVMAPDGRMMPGNLPEPPGPRPTVAPPPPAGPPPSAAPPPSAHPPTGPPTVRPPGLIPAVSYTQQT